MTHQTFTAIRVSLGKMVVALLMVPGKNQPHTPYTPHIVGIYQVYLPL